MEDNADHPTTIIAAPQTGVQGDPEKSKTSRQQVHRSNTTEIIAEGKDLKDAAEQTLNFILEIDLDGCIRWVSPSWQDVIGTAPDSLPGTPIADLILDDEKNAFFNAVEDLRKDDSGSRIIHLSVPIVEASVLFASNKANRQADETEPDSEHDQHVLELEAQGMLVYDRSTGKESHTMWMVRPAITREVTIDLPPFLVESLGDGAEMLAHHLTLLAKHGNTDPEHNPPPLPVLCRICERQITPWWIPKHSDLCLQEHQAEADLHLAQENLTEHRNTIVKILDALEARSRWRSLRPAENSSPPPLAEYKSLPIGAEPSAHSSRGVSPNRSPSHSRDRSSSGLSHSRPRSFTVRRPLSTKVELILDLCDTALEISQPSLKERLEHADDAELRTQSPLSENRISQVLQWQSPVVEGEAGFAALCEDTANLTKAKVDAVLLCRRIIEYSERIRAEYASLVQECIDAALQKAAQIAAGEISDDSGDELSAKDEEDERIAREAEPEEESTEHLTAEAKFDTTELHHPQPMAEDESLAPTDSSELQESIPDENPQPEADSEKNDEPRFPRRLPSHSYDRPSAMSVALRTAGSRSRSPSISPNRQASSTLSTRSSSPRSCPTPKSRGASVPAAAPRNDSTTSTTELDTWVEGDASARSSFRSQSRSGRMSSSEFGITRVASTRESKRTSLVLPREHSMTRQESPNRSAQGMPPPSSPLRINKPRLPVGSVESARSPVISPTLGSLEFYSPTLGPMDVQHRRQSSAASSDISRAAISPRLSFAGNPQPRAVPPSIRDFEIIKPISKGAFGSVYLSKKKSTGDYFAIKALKKQDMVAKNQVANVKAERAIMMFQGESDFVAKLYWTFPSKDYIFLVMEYLNGGDCASLVQSLGALPEDWAKKYIAEVVLGIEHLHSREIVHRDLKPDNLLIDQKGHLKLTDFGLSRMGLIGRQKRALSTRNNGSAPDPLKQGAFHRSVSMNSSSRSTSIDAHGANTSPSQTPYLAPAFSADGSQPSYFSLGRESISSSREGTRQSSMHQSDNGDADQLQSAFRRFSIYDDPWGLNRSSPREEENRELNEGAESLNLHETTSNPNSAKIDPSAHTTGNMGPPPMALFDPEDSNRRFVGTPDYLAPETINGLGQDEMSDWWSLGCILFEFLFGYPPFHAKTPDEVFDNILNRRIEWPPEEYDNDVSVEAKDLMNRLMCLDSGERLGANAGDNYSSGAEEIRRHPWFADIDWDTLKDAEASFVPAPENIEDTEYFDARGATAHDFGAEFDDQSTSPAQTPVGDFERPHDALAKVRTQVNSMKRGLMPLHIPPHVRDGRSRRLSEPVASDDFGQFSFKNLSVLEKANKDVIQKLRAEAMQAQSRTAQGANQTAGGNSPPSLESSPVIGAPIKRALSTNRGQQRSASPSTLNHSNSSPSRASQPSSPLVQFSTGALHERRKTSGGNSSAPQAIPPLPAGGLFEIPKLPPSMKSEGSSASSPVKTLKPPSLQPDPIPGHVGNTSPRARSHTVGSNESEVSKDRMPHHYKRRSQVIDISPSSSDTEDPRAKAILRVQRRRQSSRRLSQISIGEGPLFRPLDVLVVEDHPVSRLVMEKLLEKLRCRTIIVNDGAEAMRYAMTSVKFDIIMMEFKLPRVNGADVARMLRETKNANCQTPIVAVTGYLKELTAPHHFDALVEKPPSQAKLTEVMSRLCQWKAPTPGAPSSHFPMQQPQASMPPSGLRKGSLAMDESPTSTTSSGYPSLPSLSQRGSSREDSLSTVSAWTEGEVASEDGIQVQAFPEWHANRENPMGGLGISGEADFGVESAEPMSGKQIPTLVTHDSAPASLAAEPPRNSIRKKPSSEQVEAKKKALNKLNALNTGESGDDEDDELGSPVTIASRGPKPRSRQGHYRATSKLSTEMMRSNSQGTVTESTPDTSLQDLESQTELSETESAIEHQILTPPPPSMEGPLLRSLEELKLSMIDQGTGQAGHLVPPEVFPQHAGGEMKELSMEAMPESRPEVESDDQTKTPQPEVITELSHDPDSTPTAISSPPSEAR